MAVRGEKGWAPVAAEGDGLHLGGRQQIQRQGHRIPQEHAAGGDVTAELDRLETGARIHRGAAPRREIEGHRGLRPRLQHRTHALEVRRHRLRGEEREGGEIGALHARPQQRARDLRVHRVRVIGLVARLEEIRRDPEAAALGVGDLGGDHEHVEAALEERALGARVEHRALSVPDELPQRGRSRRGLAGERQDEGRLAGDALDGDGLVEGERDAGVHGEAVELVEQGDLVAAGGIHRTARLGQDHAATRALGGIRDRVAVAGEDRGDLGGPGGHPDRRAEQRAGGEGEQPGRATPE